MAHDGACSGSLNSSRQDDVPGSESVEVHVQWATGGQKQAAVNATEKVLEEKERRLVESIQKNYGRIKEVERELAALQLQLRMNVGPKKQALELMRRKIEAQNERVQAATQRRNAAKKAFEEASEQLSSEERVKEQLCQELNLLVQQSANAQLDKLDQLTSRLEMLNSGIAMADAHSSREIAPKLPQRAQQQATQASQLAAAVQQGAGALRKQIAAAADDGSRALPAQQGQRQGKEPSVAGGDPPAGGVDPTNPFLAATQGEQGSAGGGVNGVDHVAKRAAVAHAQQEAAAAAEAAADQQRRADQAQAEAASARHVSLGRPGGGGRGRGASHRGLQHQPPPHALQHPQQHGRPRSAREEGAPFQGFD